MYDHPSGKERSGKTNDAIQAAEAFITHAGLQVRKIYEKIIRIRKLSLHNMVKHRLCGSLPVKGKGKPGPAGL